MEPFNNFHDRSFERIPLVRSCRTILLSIYYKIDLSPAVPSWNQFLFLNLATRSMVMSKKSYWQQ